MLYSLRLLNFSICFNKICFQKTFMVFFGVWYTGKHNSIENKPNIPECHILNEPPQINSAYFQGHNQTSQKK